MTEGLSKTTDGDPKAVAILAKNRIEDVREGLPGDDVDDHARYIEGVISTKDGAVRVASIYLPNGNPVDTDKFVYKLKWMDRLIEHAEELRGHEEALVLGGDYNVIPTAEDVFDPMLWTNDALFRLESRRQLPALLRRSEQSDREVESRRSDERLSQTKRI